MFDLRTISIAITLVNILLAIIMVNYWRIQKPYPGFGYWTFGNVSAAIAFLLLGFRGIIPGFFSIVLANGAVLLVSILHLEALRSFYGHTKPFRWHIFTMAAILIESFYFSQIYDSPAIRVLSISILVILNGVITLRTLIKNATPRQHFLPYMLGILYAFYMIILSIRSYAWWTNPVERAIFSPTSINTIFFFFDLVSMIGTTITFILMNNQRLADELYETHLSLEKMASIDSLTGVLNRGYFYESGHHLSTLARQYDHTFSVIVLDFDQFKDINDVHGHHAGDLVLTKGAEIIRSHIRERDKIGRIGGDEFGICLPETSLTGAMEVGQRIRQNIAAYSFEWSGKEFHVSVSLGISSYRKDDKDFSDAMVRADQHLLDAKRKGKNLVVGDIATESVLPAL